MVPRPREFHVKIALCARAGLPGGETQLPAPREWLALLVAIFPGLHRTALTQMTFPASYFSVR